MCHCWLVRYLELWIVHLLVLPEPIIQIPAVQQHFFALGFSRDFENDAVQNKGKKKRAQRVSLLDT